jgi:hypothetical protein
VGIELIFLNHFDADRPEMFDVWRSTFDNINEFGRLPRSAEWRRGSPCQRSWAAPTL